VLARARALDRANQGHLQEAWDGLGSMPEIGPAFPVRSTRAEFLQRSGRIREALEEALEVLDLATPVGLVATHGKERGDLLHLAARCARRLGRSFLPLLEQSVSEGNIDARCDLVLLGIEKGVPSAWKDLDVLLRTHAGHPSALIAASEAARSQGDRSTSDLLLQQASSIPSEAALRAKGRLWMRAWLGGASPAFELPATDIENTAATALDRVVRGLPWKPDPFLVPDSVRRTLGEILQALLDAGREDAVRAFAANATGRDADLPGITTLVEGA